MRSGIVVESGRKRWEDREVETEQNGFAGMEKERDRENAVA